MDESNTTLEENVNEPRIQSLSSISNKNKFLLLILSLFFGFFVYVFSAPRPITNDIIISVTRGESIKQIAQELHTAGIIRSRTLFTVLIQISDKPIVAAGDYLFQKPQSIFTVVHRFKNAQYGLPVFQITLNEGMTVREMADKIVTVFPKIDKNKFIEIALPFEGYLFPDTYAFNENVTAEEVLKQLRNNFDKKIASIKEKIEQSPYTPQQIIIMASIVEKEATADSRQQVANILWNRFEIGMALQVDASFVYGIGKATDDLTTADLEKDGPYNTYKNVGLTPTPISNPGLESIEAAANPQPTDALYFLTGRDGKMYYAKSFEEHKRNRTLYLD